MEEREPDWQNPLNIWEMARAVIRSVSPWDLLTLGVFVVVLVAMVSG